jgi:hypothetical protein
LSAENAGKRIRRRILEGAGGRIWTPAGQTVEALVRIDEMIDPVSWKLLPQIVIEWAFEPDADAQPTDVATFWGRSSRRHDR